jgi:hypothetical protein
MTLLGYFAMTNCKIKKEKAREKISARGLSLESTENANQDVANSL